MTGKNRLSIIIVNFNTYPFLAECLDSIYSVDFKKSNFEIIVIDNNSRDDSVVLLKKNYPLVQLIQNKKNVGFAAANNKAIRKATGKYILLLNPDTVVFPKTFSTMVSYMEKNKDVGISSCRVEFPSGEIDDACHRGFPTPWNAFCQFSGLSKIFPNSMYFNGYHLGYKDLDKVHEIDSCAGAFMLVRYNAGEQIAWFDEDFFWYGEDIDFCFRMKKRSWRIMFVPHAKIIHFKGVSGGIKKRSVKISTADNATKIMATRSRFAVMRIFYEKHYKNTYPRVLTSLVMTGIKLKEYFSLLRYR